MASTLALVPLLADTRGVCLLLCLTRMPEILFWLTLRQAQRDAENCVSNWGDIAGWVDTLPAWRGNAAPTPPVR